MSTSSSISTNVSKREIGRNYESKFINIDTHINVKVI